MTLTAQSHCANKQFRFCGLKALRQGRAGQAGQGLQWCLYNFLEPGARAPGVGWPLFHMFAPRLGWPAQGLFPLPPTRTYLGPISYSYFL